ncbi:hypothetical protein Dimus_032895 [Dionaea muscipula]
MAVPREAGVTGQGPAVRGLGVGVEKAGRVAELLPSEEVRMDRFDRFRCSGEGGQEAGSSSRFTPLSELEEDAFMDGDDSLGDSDIDRRRIGSPCLDELVVETGVDVGGFESPSRGLQACRRCVCCPW